MIKANELRIGNYLHDLNNKIVKIETISCNNVRVSSIDSSYNFGSFNLNENFLHPILITAEILEKCGFIKVDHKYNLYGLEYYDNAIWFDTTRIEIKYLHELQNWHWILSKNELEINF